MIYREGIQYWKLSLLPKQPVGLILDLGCGITTPYKEVLSKLGEYVGVDFRFSRKITVQADARMLPFRDKCFDFVWASEFMEHIEIEDQEKVVGEMLRVLRGTAIITYPTERHHNFHRDPTHRAVKINWNKYGKYVETSSGEAIITIRPKQHI